MEHDELRPGRNFFCNLHSYQLYSSLLIGGSEVLRPQVGTLHPISGTSLGDNSYLNRLPGETSYQRNSGLDAFIERRNTAAHDPVSSRIIWCYVDTLFRQSIDRRSVGNVLGHEILRDVDLKGSPVDDWLSSAYYQGLGFGWIIAIVDKDCTDEEIPSHAHAPGHLSRPYVQFYTPLRIWDLELDEFDNITKLAIRESVDHIRVWTDFSSDLYEIKSGDLVESKSHGFGYVPAVLFRANDSSTESYDSPPGESAIKAISLLDLQILQQLSLLNDVEKKTAFPFLHIERDSLLADDSPEGDQTLGSDFILAVEASVKWVSPPPSSPQEIRNYCDWLESKAYKIGGVHRRSQDSVEAHSGLALDYENSPIYATVQRWSRRLRTFELKIWRIFADIMDLDPSEIDVLYPDDFSNRPIAQDVGIAKEIAGIYGGYDRTPYFAKVGIDALVLRVIERTVGSDKRVIEAISSYGQGESIDGQGESIDGQKDSREDERDTKAWESFDASEG